MQPTGLLGSTWLVYHRDHQQQVKQLLGSRWDMASLTSRLPQLAAGFETLAGLTGSGQVVVQDRWPSGLRRVSPEDHLWDHQYWWHSRDLCKQSFMEDLLKGEQHAAREVKKKLLPSMVLLVPDSAVSDDIADQVRVTTTNTLWGKSSNPQLACPPYLGCVSSLLASIYVLMLAVWHQHLMSTVHDTATSHVQMLYCSCPLRLKRSPCSLCCLYAAGSL
jgi:hypothetical protein